MVTGVQRSTLPEHHRHSTTASTKTNDTDDDGDETPTSTGKRLLIAIGTIPQRMKNTTSNTNLLEEHVPKLQRPKDKLVEFEHPLLNHLSLLVHKIRKETNCISSKAYSEMRQLSTGNPVDNNT